FFQAEDGIRDFHVTGVQTCALPISGWRWPGPWWKPTAADWSWARRARRSSRYTCRWPGPMTCWACRGGANRPRGELAVRAQRRRSEERRVGKECRARWERDAEQ